MRRQLDQYAAHLGATDEHIVRPFQSHIRHSEPFDQIRRRRDPRPGSTRPHLLGNRLACKSHTDGQVAGKVAVPAAATAATTGSLQFGEPAKAIDGTGMCSFRHARIGRVDGKSVPLRSRTHAAAAWCKSASRIRRVSRVLVSGLREHQSVLDAADLYPRGRILATGQTRFRERFLPEPGAPATPTDSAVERHSILTPLRFHMSSHRSGAARAEAPLRQVATPRNWLRGRCPAIQCCQDKKIQA